MYDSERETLREIMIQLSLLPDSCAKTVKKLAGLITELLPNDRENTIDAWPHARMCLQVAADAA